MLILFLGVFYVLYVKISIHVTVPLREHLEQIPLSRYHLSISGMYQLSLTWLTWFRPNSWDHLYQMPKVTVTFVQATYVLATFVHISNISAVTHPIFTKLFDPIFGGKNVFDQNFVTSKLFSNQNVLTWYLFGPKICLDPKICWTQSFSNQNFFGWNFVKPKLLWAQNFL